MNVKGTYYVPVNLPDNVVWCEQLECDRFDRTDVKLEEDLRRIEVLLNKTEEVFFNHLEKYLMEKGIKINRSGG